MKNIAFLFSFLFIGISAMEASEANSRSVYKDAFIFVENGVEFAVYPNGEFDFYYNPEFRRTQVLNISTPNMNISYNAGYNYDAYIQYDDYGAVIQIESVPVYYDYYGRIIRAGNVDINYNRYGRIARVGNLYIHYNRFNRITNYTGFINHFNYRYAYRPWHQYYTRPHRNVSIVYGQPYRAYYQPNRLTYVQHVNYFNNHYSNNVNQNFYRPNQTVVSYNKGRRTSGMRDLKEIRSNQGQVASNDYNIRSNRNSERSSKVSNRSRTIQSERKSSNNSRRNSMSSSRSMSLDEAAGTRENYAGNQIRNNRSRTSGNTASRNRSFDSEVNSSRRSSQTINSGPSSHNTRLRT
ncbi:hypothetical protein, partial [Salegentibacter sp. 24]|uniref:hypothetical protein n=1 Tax=Salegentibacter sp. 24 TaxID=2183986 RepID=UPI00105C4B24